MSILLLQLFKKTHFVYHDEQFITIFVMCDKQKEEMERLFESFIKKLAITNTSFVRSLMNEIEWKARLIGIKGAWELENNFIVAVYQTEPSNG